MDANTLQPFVTTEMHAPLMSVIPNLDHAFILRESALQIMLVKRFTVITSRDVLQLQEIAMTTFHVPLIHAILNSDASTSQAKAHVTITTNALKTDVS
jgi:hypothetical protein